ncbi:MAG: helix-turn-helix domain-containing protein [Alphaproteobacteria bacterium]|nr:helix-turn-helix domain-containing protein [Alphaproteobacteria bacterium]MBL6939427.1 helix-turn-helix domain-containing protein [Alphaproteobacteria bacterium]MBL7097092.1 helix-turn-helix domain-containing protein [Alphaproteobacteria bacterium]
MDTGIDALRRAKTILGGTEAAIAAVVGVTQPAVNYVFNTSKKVPAEWCIPLERATEAKGQKIGRQQFRPDIYPPEDHADHVRARHGERRCAALRPQQRARAVRT